MIARHIAAVNQGDNLSPDFPVSKEDKVEVVDAITLSQSAH